MHCLSPVELELFSSTAPLAVSTKSTDVHAVADGVVAAADVAAAAAAEKERPQIADYWSTSWLADYASWFEDSASPRHY